MRSWVVLGLFRSWWPGQSLVAGLGTVHWYALTSGGGEWHPCGCPSNASWEAKPVETSFSKNAVTKKCLGKFCTFHPSNLQPTRSRILSRWESYHVSWFSMPTLGTWRWWYLSHVHWGMGIFLVFEVFLTFYHAESPLKCLGTFWGENLGRFLPEEKGWEECFWGDPINRGPPQSYQNWVAAEIWDVKTLEFHMKTPWNMGDSTHITWCCSKRFQNHQSVRSDTPQLNDTVNCTSVEDLLNHGEMIQFDDCANMFPSIEWTNNTMSN